MTESNENQAESSESAAAAPKTPKKRKRLHRDFPLRKLEKCDIDNLISRLKKSTPNTLQLISFLKQLLKWDAAPESPRKLTCSVLVSREQCVEKNALVIAYYKWEDHRKGYIYVSSQLGLEVFKMIMHVTGLSFMKRRPCEWNLFPLELADVFLTKLNTYVVDDYTLYQCSMYYLPKAKLNASGYDFRDLKCNALTKDCAYVVNENWPRHYRGSESIVEQAIKENQALGLFNFHGELVGWAIEGHMGAMTMPFILPKYRGKKNGRDLLLSLSASITSEKGIKGCIVIPKDDNTTKQFLTDSGFVFVGDVFNFSVNLPIDRSTQFPRPNLAK